MQGQQFTIYTSQYREAEKNAIYPYKVTVSSVADMAKAAAVDHVCATYRENYRANNHFVSADCLPMDLDNDSSDDPTEWRTLEHIQKAFPNVPFYAVESRNHMKPKKGKVPRPKYHVYFPISAVTDAREYARLKAWVRKAFPYFDKGAADAARFFYGVENPKMRI